MGSSAATQGLQGVVVNAVMRKVQPRVQRLCNVKTAALLEYSMDTYARFARAVVPIAPPVAKGFPPFAGVPRLAWSQHEGGP